jgi:hypothetical protein
MITCVVQNSRLSYPAGLNQDQRQWRKPESQGHDMLSCKEKSWLHVTLGRPFFAFLR